jgi:hypothetical protein
MQRSTTSTAAVTEPSTTRRFSEQPDDEHGRGDATFRCEGPIGVADEADDVGSDPYNRTGRFRRVVR